ncbi:hypothetical protein VNI00_003696 [Paramarasmius palmivorus]|uniref:Uncharacterized protein n=1 Tax=Paramarasmius palmivorus TaxID=297713 RepID=A0AAW0DS93_9AGAR
MNARHYFQRREYNGPARSPVSIIPSSLPTGRRSGHFPSDNVANRYMGQRNETINEAGLPLFKPVSRDGSAQEGFKMVEIKVDTECVQSK